VLKADLVFANGNVLTMDTSRPDARAVAVQGGQILAVGSDSDVKAYIGSGTEVVDLRGKTLLPGFNDSHMHLLWYGLSLVWVNLTGVTSVAAVVDKVRAKAAITPPGQWIVGFGWDQNLFREGRFLHRRDLDAATTDHPVALSRVCVHLRACNSLALKLAGIDRHTPDPPSGEIDRDSDGEPTGILREAGAFNLVDRFTTPPPYVTAKAALRQAMAKAIAAGITSVTTDDVRHAGGVENCLSLYRATWESGGPAVRAYLCIINTALDDLLALGLKTGDGDARVRIGPLKIFHDGGLGGRTAALREPYTSDPENRGVLYMAQEQLDEIVAKGHGAGMQVAVHALGDAAIASVLTAYDRALTANPRENHRHRIIHYCILREDLLPKTRRLAVGVDIQPRFVSLNGRVAETFLGPERVKLTYPWKTIREFGVPMAGGSDCPVERHEPLLGIHAAVNRQVDSAPGFVFRPEERLAPYEALQLYTTASAYSTFAENEKGTITPGKLADLVVLSDDPCAVPPTTLKDLQVEMTVVDGKIVYSND